MHPPLPGATSPPASVHTLSLPGNKILYPLKQNKKATQVVGPPQSVIIFGQDPLACSRVGKLTQDFVKRFVKS